MKRLLGITAVLLGLGVGVTGAQESVVASGLALEGEIEGENIVFTLTLDAEVKARKAVLPLVVGDVAYLDGTLPRGSELVREGAKYLLKLSRTHKESVMFRFASRPTKAGDWRTTKFSIPVANVRKVSVLCDRDDLEIRFPGALDVKRQKTEAGKMRVTAFLGIAGAFEVRWKPEVKKLDAELVVACEANTIATANVGALKIDTVLTYRVIQGMLERLEMELPDVNVTQVLGEDIQDWDIDLSDKNRPRLVVMLSRPKEDVYRLQVESELILPEFPCAFDLPVFAPRDVIRTSGFLMIGTDSAVKLQVKKAAGLTQVDQASFPTVVLDAESGRRRATPSRSVYAYQYANTPYTLALNADDIVTSYAADNRLVLSFADNELVLDASIELSVKDAPAREIRIETDPDPSWTITSVSGRHVSEADTDVRTETLPDGTKQRLIYVPFRPAVDGTTLINVRMERTLGANASSFHSPRFSVLGSKSQRGYLVVAAEQGIRLKTETFSGMREVHTASAPMRVPGAQEAFRFKAGDWQIEMGVDRTKPAVSTELFHLVSLGEGVLYYSAAITYHISGAPVQEFQVRVPAEFENVELAGADIEGWTREKDICMVRLQSRIMGDYTLLVTHDGQFDYDSAVIAVGGIETVGSENEVGYMAIASSASLNPSESRGLPDSLIPIDPDEIPRAYSSAVADPILLAYKHVGSPHTAMIAVKRYDTEQLLGQVADYVRLSTTLSRDGESVTYATYYIKNASRQYLEAALPRGAELWSIKYIDERGRRESVLSQENQGRVLIPVKRPRDPNTAIHVEIVYAASHGKLGFWRGGVFGVGFKAPVLPAANSTFANWSVSVPEGHVIAGCGGNMSAGTQNRGVGLLAAFAKTWRLLSAVTDGPGGRTLRSALAADWGGIRTQEFSRNVNLAGMGPLTVRLYVVPDWIGSASSARLLVVWLLAGLLLVAAGSVQRRRPALLALGLIASAFGFSQAAAGRSIVAVLFLLAIAWILLYLLLAKGGIRLLFVMVYRPAGWCVRIVWSGLKQASRWLGRAWRALRESRERAHFRKLELRMATSGPGYGPPLESPQPTGSGTTQAGPSAEKADNAGGATSPGLLCLVAVAAASLALAGPEQATQAPVPAPVMDVVVVTVDAPGTGRDIEQSAEVGITMSFSVGEPVSFTVVPSACVLTSFELNSRYLDISTDVSGYVLAVKRRGKYKVSLNYRCPVTERDGQWTMGIKMPANMRNRVSLRLPEPDLDVTSASAVLFRSEVLEKGTEAQAVFGPVEIAQFAWRPRVRKTRLEKAAFSCEVSTLVNLQAGVVDLSSRIRYRIARGEVKEIKVRVPENMSVTAVSAPGLATWSFDPRTRELDAILAKAVSGSLSLIVDTQISCEGLPYAASIAVPIVLGASRQRGAVALAAQDTIQVKVGETSGLNPMNIGDFQARVGPGTGKKAGRRSSAASIRRAFRYHQAAEARARVETEKVLPEIRVTETGILDISDESTKLATKLELAIAKAGVFSVALHIPAGFEVESLTGRNVDHWDEGKPELEAGGTSAWQRVVVHFKQQISDVTEIDLVVARTEKGVAERITVPRVRVWDARKHQGKLTVSGERGVRIMVESHTGVDIKKSSDEGITQKGVLVFDILRPTWSINLKTDVMAPVVKPELLQIVDLTEGMLQCRAYVQYKIENAGIKSFLLKSPHPGVSLSVTGRSIARVDEEDKAEGLWRVDLHGKVENQFRMQVAYQVPYEHTERNVTIRPLQAMATDPQRGYLVVTCGGRVQVEPRGAQAGLKVEDARNIPSRFGAGDLSGAILCYRTVRPSYSLDLSVIRHDAASVLPASIEQVRLTSVVSTKRKLMTRVDLSMRVGDLRYLRVRLPNRKDRLWTVLVNGREVTTSLDKDVYCIPLKEQQAGAVTGVELVYAGSSSSAPFAPRQRFTAPNFGLPLNDIQWDFYVLPEYRYYAFGGTMVHMPGEPSAARVFNAQQYAAYNKEQREASLLKARQVLDVGGRLARAGKQKRAKQAFLDALNYSQAEADLNEDARIQLRNLEKQQWKIGLINRRDAVRFSSNIIDERQLGQMAGFQNGEYTQEYAASVEQRLSSKDNDALEMVADKMIEQQAAAAGVVTAIRITMPEHGRRLRFHRALMIDPGSELEVSFRAHTGRLTGWLNALWPAALLFVFLWGALRRRAAVGQGAEA